MRAALVILVLFCATAPAPLAGQQARGSATAPATGTGRLAGVVVDAKAQPVRSAVVRLTAPDLPGGRAAITDDSGRFVFDALPAGRFSLTSSKPAYLPSAYGAMRPGGTGTPVTLAAGEQKTDLTITMPRGSAITGVVRDENGAPVPAIQVYAIRTNAPAAAPASRQDAANTDDRGVYRIFGLAPGSYYVMVERASSGGIGGIGVMSSAEIDATFARLQARTPGAAQPSATERSPSSVVRPTRTFDPAPIFHPGVASNAGATAITLGVSEDRTGIDIVYQLVSTATVSGSVSGAGNGQSVQLSLVPEGGTPTGRGFGAGAMLQRRTSTGDGDFVFTGVTPGKYTVLAFSSASSPQGIPTTLSNSRYATAAVEVAGNDVGGVSLSMRPTLRVAGRIAFPGGTPPAGQALTNLAVSLVAPGSQASGPIVAAGGVIPAFNRTSAPVREDGTFEIAGVIEGRYRLTTARNPAGWTPKSAMLGGRDILDQVVDISGDVSGIELTMTSQTPQLSGRMMKADNTPAPGYFVIAFTTDRTLWEPNSRRLRSVRPGTDGSFRFEDLPAGEYFLAALTEADSDEWQAASFLAVVVPAAIKVTIADGEKKVQDLRIGK